MHRLSLSEFEEQADDYNAAVSAHEGIDSFCCRTDWILPFHQSFMPNSPLYIWRNNSSFVVLAESFSQDGDIFLTPLEPMWGFPSPLIGPESTEMLISLLKEKTPELDLRTKHLLLLGLPLASDVIRNISRSTGLNHRVLFMPPTERCLASLSGGIDGFLSRRSSRFRASLRRAVRKVQALGISFRHTTKATPVQVQNLYTAILAIEEKSHKGLSGQGVDRPPMKQFYEKILHRLAPAGSLRLLTAELNGRNIGYIYGAAIGNSYRGLQFSFDQRYAFLSLGNVLQYRMIEWLCESGCRTYDLGSVVPYKRRWAEGSHLTLSMCLKED